MVDLKSRLSKVWPATPLDLVLHQQTFFHLNAIFFIVLEPTINFYSFLC